MKRILALDIGDRRIGVSVSDPLGFTAQGVETIFTKGIENDIARIVELCRMYETDRVVSGLPKNMTGDEGARAQIVRDFCARLAEKGLSVRFQDERLTTVSAERMLIEADVSRKNRKKVIDKIASTYILQAFLDAGGWKTTLADRYYRRRGMSHMDENRNMDSGNDIVELFDEDGNIVRFEHLLTVRYKEDEYVVLSPVDDIDDMEEDEVLILRIDTQDGEEVYVTVEDDDVLENVFAEFERAMEEEEDAED